jgi:hypothetical protein
MMKRLSLLMLMALGVMIARAQSSPGNQATSGDRFFFGLNYSYQNTDMKLLSLTKHSVWAGEDLGTKDMSAEDIDTINSYMDYKEKLNNLSLGVGMVLLNKPGGKWCIDGQLQVGIVKRANDLTNTDNDSADIVITSEHWSPSLGLGFNFRYLFSDHWALNLGLNSMFTFGETDEIAGEIFPVIPFMQEARENHYRSSYSSIDLMASYKIKKFTIAAGPGFYLLQNWNEYHIIRTDADDGTKYEDSIETTLRTDMFINGCIRVDWRISDHFLLTAGGGFNQDISADAGLIYFL